VSLAATIDVQLSIWLRRGALIATGGLLATLISACGCTPETRDLVRISVGLETTPNKTSRCVVRLNADTLVDSTVSSSQGLYVIDVIVQARHIRHAALKSSASAQIRAWCDPAGDEDTYRYRASLARLDPSVVGAYEPTDTLGPMMSAGSPVELGVMKIRVPKRYCGG
jgi:hypothetical protein